MIDFDKLPTKGTLADLAREVGMTREEFAQQLAKELPALLRTLTDVYERLPEAAKDHFR